MALKSIFTVYSSQVSAPGAFRVKPPGTGIPEGLPPEGFSPQAPPKGQGQQITPALCANDQPRTTEGKWLIHPLPWTKVTIGTMVSGRGPDRRFLMMHKPDKILPTAVTGLFLMAGSAGSAPYGGLISVPQRGGDFFGSPERFNRYYTDRNYQPDRILHVSPDGNGDGSADSPMSADNALSLVRAGDQILFRNGQYQGCWELDDSQSGTYDKPVVLKAQSSTVDIDCCNSGRASCFNLEGANYIAIDGFKLNGGSYGVRAVGLEYAASGHQKGIAILNTRAANQYTDPFFSGQSDWIVLDGNTGTGGGDGDGHGIYLSNGGDWAIVRNNELFDNSSSDFQINADPISTCEDDSIPYDDPRCHGSALEQLGQGVSEFILVESNYFHNSDVGPNFTSVRNSVVRNNIIGPYTRHGTSFWQETDVPQLGSSDNRIEHNLFLGNNSRHVLQTVMYSDRNQIRNNILLGFSVSGSTVNANPDTVLVDVDRDTVSSNRFSGNLYIGGRFDGFSPSPGEQRLKSFNTSWFMHFPLNGMGSATDYRPGKTAPFLDSASLLATTPMDMEGRPRRNPVSAGPWEYGGQLRATITPEQKESPGASSTSAPRQ
jgi:hypothetical protein